MFVPAPVYLLPAMPFRPSVLLLLPLLGLTQCLMQGEGAYPVPPMPEPTQSGANTAGCVVDGRPWVASSDIPRIGPGTLPAVTARWDTYSAGRPKHLALYFVKSTDGPADPHNPTTIKMELAGITRPATFVLDQPAPYPAYATFATFAFTRISPNRELFTGPNSPGRVVVTRFDTLSRVASGTFEFTAREATGATTVRVTEGRFDATF